jgi:hypothetical protein
MKRATAVVLAGLSLAGFRLAFAADQCTGWMQQSDGSEWRMCTSDADGHRYCQERRGDAITTVACR